MQPEETPARIFAAMGDPTRLEILGRLSSGEPQSIIRLKAGTPLTRQAITKHLEVLESAGMVRGEHVGRERLFTLDARPIDEARGFLERMSQQWDERLRRLKLMLEDQPQAKE
jgi:DNA-binding transcriptional ArsR family regulator